MKIGILGCGSIARTIAATLTKMEEAGCYAVSSRTAEKAEAFAREYGFEKAYGSYEEMLRDPAVELVYIATPHSHHALWMAEAIRCGKPVLCEKAFTVNAKEAAQIRELAHSRGVFAAEAIWTRYMPSRAIIDEMLQSGIIGEVTALSANLSYPVFHRERLREPRLAGGALLDVGVYGINFALMHFGSAIERIESSVQMTETGVDGMESITLFYKNGRMAQIFAGILARSDRQGIFYGDRGYIVVENINNPRSVSAYDTGDRLLRKVTVPAQISGYEYEFLECMQAVREGRTESASMPLAESVHMMEVMDSIRAQWGLVYPMEK